MQVIHPFEKLYIKQTPNSLVSYKGPITPEVIVKIVEQLRAGLPKLGRLSKRIAAIAIELAQNMQNYSLELVQYGNRPERVGWFQVEDKSKYLEINCGNALNKKEVAELVALCKTISELDKEGLRGFKRQRRRMRLVQQTDGAGIGLIQVAILSGSSPKVEVVDITDDVAWIIFKINIEK
ncbi:SiaB family protein kinase [Porifericola rhodea]|uniref:SiaB family protein kinase n=1 Tax=Porifericola rhodea TaxID=930972 RepID=UPI002666168C|nr:SiaB family protein kinase [Porifericola rhodea]WKN32677.1 SiaB family protein kinase [Porifericola rhodea]